MAIAASKISLEHKIPMTDSIIPATAKKFEATIRTQDSDFKNMDNVKYFPRKSIRGEPIRIGSRNP